MIEFVLGVAMLGMFAACLTALTHASAVAAPPPPRPTPPAIVVAAVPHVVAWQTCSTSDAAESVALARAGWEPYAVVYGYRTTWRQYFKRRKP